LAVAAVAERVVEREEAWTGACVEEEETAAQEEVVATVTVVAVTVAVVAVTVAVVAVTMAVVAPAARSPCSRCHTRRCFR